MHSSFFGAFRLVAERFIRHIVGCCLLFVLIINFSPCQKANCVLFVSGGVVGEFMLQQSYNAVSHVRSVVFAPTAN